MNFNRPLILASASPRRHTLMRMAGYTFSSLESKGDESYDPQMPAKDIARHIAKKKALLLRKNLIGNEVILTADTIVIIEKKILHKPLDREDAIAMLSVLSGRTHTVMTGVCVMDKEKIRCIDDSTVVTFKKLKKKEIVYYVDHFNPYDKAGGYGVQDWIGLIGIERIEGSYFTVMGLPMHKVYSILEGFHTDDIKLAPGKPS